MERRFTNKLFVCVSVKHLTIIRNDQRSVLIGADIGILHSGDCRSRDARPSLTFSVFTQVCVPSSWMERSLVGDRYLLKQT